ncbi:MAG TPA: YafY family protein [Candidatus Dormibacteraeota bacterium]|nr:YafY family protein [Candidatus Dormibacteraeota bacterium]
MNRTDRLYALVEELRARSPRPAAADWLARKFEVSTRTVERDLAALQQTGVPIWSQPGPGGGYFLNRDATLPPVNLTAEEANAISIALAASRGLPFAKAGRSALRKLTAVMPAGEQAAAARLGDKLMVFGEATPEAANAPSHVLGPVEEAIGAGRVLKLRYRDRNGKSTARVVEPAALMVGQNGWYLIAYCRLRQEGRGFRLDRIDRATLLKETVPPRPLQELLGDYPQTVDMRLVSQLVNEE